ncbi:MAG: hypothetical protein GXY48_02740, partial [Methanomicrobiales archaeon]|nr:hypothetical protein [Methanomicrobiales archaeon]
SSYLDRRMNLIISDWQLSTKDDLNDLHQRFSRVQDNLNDLKVFEKETDERLSGLEERVKNIRRNRNDTS